MTAKTPTMNRSPFRVCVAQIAVRPGRPLENLEGMLKVIARMRAQDVDLVVFPEMAIPGYLLADEWERNAFLRECEDCTEALIRASSGLVLIFGNVAVDRTRVNEDGRPRKYNALFVAENGRPVRHPQNPLPFVVKTLMPNYRQFDDSRHFYDARKLAVEEGLSFETLIRPVPTRLGRIGCMICEDAWDPDYGISPMKLLAEAGADFFVNISASPFTWNKNHKRRRLMNQAAVAGGRPLIYCNQVGIQNNGKTVYAFDGRSCVYDGRGNAVVQPTPFHEAPLILEMPPPGSAFGTPVHPEPDTLAEVASALMYASAAFMRQLGIERVVLGISGGIDSALCAALLSQSISAENLVLVNMPSRHNSPTTIALARKLAANLGTPYAEIPIDPSVALTRRQIDGLRIETASGAGKTLRLNEAVLENVQARDRSARVLSAIAASLGGVFPCNANKSEITVGYGTLYGDISGFLAPLGDLWKTEVWAMAEHFNHAIFGAEVIPAGSIALTPSAELGPSQNVDRGQGDPLYYPYHDRLFASWVERWNRFTPEEILEEYRRGTLAREIGFAGRIEDLFKDAAAFVADLERWWNLYQGMGLAKRIQAPPLLAVKRRAFGFDHRESQLGPRYTRRYREIKNRLLTGVGQKSDFSL